MPVPVLRRALDMFGPVLIQFYGMTETGVSTVFQAHQHVLDGAEHQVARLASAGQATFRSRVKVVTGDGTDAAPGIPGEVWLSGPTIMCGYWQKPEMSAATLIDGWVRSGDVGKLDDEQYLTIVDRMKDVIITGGENVYPREVEEALLAHSAVEQAAVIGVPDPRWGEAVSAFVVPRNGEVAGADELIAFCRTRIASYKKPQRINFVSELPRLANGKVDKTALRAMLQNTADKRRQ
jgi:acyl-CoA synthetase (AMP-forming)/AMP-acid ligase II